MSGGPRIAVIDHGAGNLVSISQALARCGADAEVVTGPAGLAGADGVVLPGVGATATVMAGIEGAGFTDYLAAPPVPLLGVCVGMQVLFDHSAEDDSACLGLIAGNVRRLEGAPRLPHIGWNDLTVSDGASLFAGLADPIVYFVHSYAPVPTEAGTVTATCRYGEAFVAAVESGDVYGVQFHPERSGPTGLRVLARFVDRCQAARHVA